LDFGASLMNSPLHDLFLSKSQLREELHEPDDILDKKGQLLSLELGYVLTIQ
jgi:hypothetical protein